MAFKPWRALPGSALLWILNSFSAVALIFEGYNQGVMGAVNGTPGYINTVNIGADGQVTNTTKQGGLVSVYYFGAIFGCFISGFIGDRFGRRIAVALGSALAIVGGALQAGSQSANMTIVARTVTGLGIGFVNTIIPAWVSELAQAHNRGSAFALVFAANYVGITIAYWIGFGLRDNTTDFRWRFPLAFQIVPLLIVLGTVGFLPESPRYLLTVGRRDEALEILAKVRGDVDLQDPALKAEVAQLDAIVSSSRNSRYSYHNLFLWGRRSGKLHLGRRIGLAVGIMMMMEWTGILAITTYSNTLFEQAGYSTEKSLLLSGIIQIVGILGTLTAVFTIDGFGRRPSLLFGFIVQGAVLLLSGGLSRLGELHPDQAGAYGAASVSMVFIYTFVFAQTVLMIAFIYPTEIWPQEMRARGNAFGVFGWAVGCGTTTLAIPSMFSALGYKTLIVFGAFNFGSVPLVWLFFPETKGRSLEEINLLFCSESPLAKSNERTYGQMLARHDGDVASAEREILEGLNVGEGGCQTDSELGKGEVSGEEKV